MSTAAVQPEERRRRRRLALLWFGGALAIVVLAAAVVVVVGRDGGTGLTGTDALDADGTGTAPVYDRPPVDVEPDSTTTSGASASRPDGAAPRRMDGAQTRNDAAQTPPRPHGIGLRLTSTVNGPLRPGVPRTLKVSVRNPNPFAVQLFRLDVRVLPPPVAGCLTEWVQTGRYRYAGGPAKTIGGLRTITVDLPITLVNLVDVDQNACQGTAFPLRLSGIAVDHT